MIFGIASYYYIKIKYKSKSKNNINNNRISNYYLIYKENIVLPNINIFHFLLFCLLYVFYLESIEITYYLGFHDLDLWVFNIVFTSFFMRVLLKIQIFNHQIYSLSFIFFINLIIVITKNFLNDNNDVYNNVENLLGNKYYIFCIY